MGDIPIQKRVHTSLPFQPPISPTPPSGTATLFKMAETTTGDRDFLPDDIHNRPDEFKIEQGLHAGQLPFLDQTGDVTVEIHPRAQPELSKDVSAIKAVGDRDELFKRERDGWEG